MSHSYGTITTPEKCPMQRHIVVNLLFDFLHLIELCCSWGICIGSKLSPHIVFLCGPHVLGMLIIWNHRWLTIHFRFRHREIWGGGTNCLRQLNYTRMFCFTHAHTSNFTHVLEHTYTHTHQTFHIHTHQTLHFNICNHRTWTFIVVDVHSPVDWRPCVAQHLHEPTLELHYTQL